MLACAETSKGGGTMANYNKVILIGNLTRDPQLSYTPSQTAVVELGLAVNRKWKSQDGQARDETCFVELKAFGRPAETINQYMSKGRPILVEGRLQFQQWTAQDGTKRSKHVVIVENFQFLGGRPEGSTQPQNAAASQQPQGGSSSPAPVPPAGEESQLPPGGGSDDDVPF